MIICNFILVLRKHFTRWHTIFNFLQLFLESSSWRCHIETVSDSLFVDEWEPFQCRHTTCSESDVIPWYFVMSWRSVVNYASNFISSERIVLLGCVMIAKLILLLCFCLQCFQWRVKFTSVKVTITNSFYDRTQNKVQIVRQFCQLFTVFPFICVDWSQVVISDISSSGFT